MAMQRGVVCRVKLAVAAVKGNEDGGKVHDDVFTSCYVSPPLTQAQAQAPPLGVGLAWLSIGTRRCLVQILHRDGNEEEEEEGEEVEGENVKDCLYVPPLILHRLGVLSFRAMSTKSLCVEVQKVVANEDTPTRVRVIRELTLAPIKGHYYKGKGGTSTSLRNEEVEANETRAVGAFFTTPRSLCKGDAICVDVRNDRNRWCIQNNNTLQWYLVTELALLESETLGEVEALTFTSPQITKVVLSSAAVACDRLPDMHCTALLLRNDGIDTGRGKGGEIVEMPATTASFRNDAIRLLTLLSPGLELHGLHRCVKENLVYSPYLIQAASNQDARVLLLYCAASLGLCLHIIDARLLHDYPLLKRTGQEIGLVSRGSEANEDMLLPSHVSLAVRATIEDVLQRCPCILYVQGIDELHTDLSSSQQNQGEGSAEGGGDVYDMIAANLKLFHADLVKRLSVGSEVGESGADASGESSFRDARVCFTIANTTASASGLKGSLRSFFTSEFIASTSPDKEQMERNLSFATKDLAKQVEAEIARNGGGADNSTLLCRELALASLTRRQSGLWMSNGGFELPIVEVRAAAGGEERQTEAALGCHIQAEDLASATKRLFSALSASSSSGCQQSSSSGANVAPVQWADIGGLTKVRREILDVLQLPTLRPELFPPHCPTRKAVLLYGPPGTGKTLVARAVATECGMAFLSVKGPELLDVYVGESERNVRQVFANARSIAPCVLFFDELDSLAPARGRGGDAGGVMDRVVAQLLSEMDSLSLPSSDGAANEDAKSEISSSSSSKNVFVIAATNRPDLLDPALLRPGRFDRKVFLSVCRDIKARAQIIKAQTRKLNMAGDVDLWALAESLPDRVTGADIGAVTSSAFSTARERKLQELRREALDAAATRTSSSSTSTSPSAAQAGSREDEEAWVIAAHVNSLPQSELQVVVTQSDFISAIKQVNLSVSAEELVHYEALASRFED